MAQCKNKLTEIDFDRQHKRGIDEVNLFAWRLVIIDPFCLCLLLSLTAVLTASAGTFSAGSSNYVVLTFADNSASPVSQTNVFGFIVVKYPTIPATSMATADTSHAGFTGRIFQGGAATVTTAETADAMLAENQESDSVVVFRVDARTGRLSATGQSVSVGVPVCALFAPAK